MCELLEGYSKLCDEVGGVDTWYAFSITDELGVSNIASYTVVAGEVTALTLTTGNQAFAFNVEMETSTFTDTSIGDRANGAYAREQEATIVLHGNTKEMIVNIEAMGKGRTAWIAKLNDGTYELLFAENGAKMSDARTPGQAYEDGNMNTLTATGKEKSKAPKLNSALIATLIVPAV